MEISLFISRANQGGSHFGARGKRGRVTRSMEEGSTSAN